jgi:taurine dioxygenase
VLGAEIRGIDLARPLDDGDVRRLRQALLDHLVLFFHDQSLDHDRHKDLGRLFGPLHIHPRAPSPEGHPELLVIHADENSKRVAGQGWHTDVSCDAAPPMGSILHLSEVPADGGGDTLFANMYAAFDALSTPLQDLLRGLTARHDSAHVYRGRYYEKARGARDEHPSSDHPVVRTHPETGRQALFVNSGFTTRINGLERSESRALLDFLFRHIDRHEFHCRFRWRAGSVAFWDNRSTQHLAVFDYWPQVRHGVRVTVAGDAPFYRAEPAVAATAS